MRAISTGSALVILFFVMGLQMGGIIINSMNIGTSIWGANTVYNFQTMSLTTTTDLNATNISMVTDLSSDWMGNISQPTSVDFGGFSLSAMATASANVINALIGVGTAVYSIIVDTFGNAAGVIIIASTLQTLVWTIIVIFAWLILTGRTVLT